MKDPYTMGYYLNAVDLRYDANKNIVQKAEYLKIYNTIWLRTLKVSLMVTLFCLLLAYPVAYLLATLANENLKSTNDMCVDAFLDITFSKNCCLDDYASAKWCCE